jgi:putative membrane protein
MIRMLVSVALHLGANAVGLAVAAALLEDMTVGTLGFVVAVAIFTLVEVIAQPLITSMALKRAEFLRGGTALVTTFVGLLITTLLTDSLTISGVGTWVAATVIVWLAAMLAALILPVIFVKKAVSERSDTE